MYKERDLLCDRLIEKLGPFNKINITFDFLSALL